MRTAPSIAKISARLVQVRLSRLLAVLSLTIAAVSALNLAAEEKKSVESRWEKDIRAIEARISSGDSAKGSIVFVGSSSIRLWDLKKSFPDRITSNHGFGGSEISDSIEFFERIVVPVQPQAVVLYAGDNDIGKGKTADTVVAHFKEFVGRCEKLLKNGTPVVFIAIKPSLKRLEKAAIMEEANTRVRAICDQSPNLLFVDIWKPMLDETGKPMADIFKSDGLHLNDKGYEIWNREVAAALNQFSKNSVR